jgi:hypothetical protein
MAWTYQQNSGWLLDPNGMKVARGYSGAGVGKNNPAMQNVVDVGPLPCGTYTKGEMQDSPEHGPDAIPLTPSPTNEMFGRSGFWMHGDSIDDPGHASEGCCIQPRFARDRFNESDDPILEVVSGVFATDSEA